MTNRQQDEAWRFRHWLRILEPVQELPDIWVLQTIVNAYLRAKTAHDKKHYLVLIKHQVRTILENNPNESVRHRIEEVDHILPREPVVIDLNTSDYKTLDPVMKENNNEQPTAKPESISGGSEAGPTSENNQTPDSSSQH